MTSAHLPKQENFQGLVEDFQIISFLYKPFGVEELRNAISKVFLEKPFKIKRLLEISNSYYKPQDQKRHINEKYSLKAAVSDLREEIGATTVVLFRIHPISHRVKILQRAGRAYSLYNYTQKLRYSPVKDVAIDREHIFERRIVYRDNYPKHRWLLKAIEYESCIAFPVKTPSEYAYSLFAFHNEVNYFDDKDVYKVMVTANEIACIIEMQRLEDIHKAENPFVIAGKTYGSMAHDLMQSLGVEFIISKIYSQIGDKTALDIYEIRDIELSLKKLENQIKRAKGTTETFRRMAKGQHELETVVDVFEAIVGACDILDFEFLAMNSKIIISEIDQSLQRHVKIRPAALEQLICNILLNAAQQIEMFKFIRPRGTIYIEFSNIEKRRKSWLQILIHDSGPGIHSYNFNKVFEMGYTTKEDGCGMGLDICRNIVEHAGGKIKINKSILFSGTTFELLLPLYQEEK